MTIEQFFDEHGRLTVWPARPAHRQAVLERLLDSFEPGRLYSEPEVNDVLKDLHTFGDHALLRRELFERGLLDRERNGAAYWVAKGRPPLG